EQRSGAGQGPAAARPRRPQAGRQGARQGVPPDPSRRAPAARWGAAAPGQSLMHPNPLFRVGDRALLEALIDEVGFGMVFAPTPHGPRVAHVPVVSTGDGAIRFHLARGNALTTHLAGTEALAVINGPDAYI